MAWISFPQLFITSRWLIFPNMPNYSLWTFNISFWNKYFMYVWISLDLFSIILIRMRKYHFIGFTCIWFNSNEKALIHPNSILEFIWPCFIHCMSLLYVCINLRQQNSLKFALPFGNKMLFSDNKLQTVNMTVLVKCKNLVVNPLDWALTYVLKQ